MKKCIECKKNVVDHHRTLFCKECFNKFTEGVGHDWKKVDNRVFIEKQQRSSD